MAKKFKRVYRERQGSSDETGRVQVRIILFSEDPSSKASPRKGNITRQILFTEAKVSEVHDAIDAALCEKEGTGPHSTGPWYQS